MYVYHRFVRPTAMSEQRITEYIEGKYGKFGVDRYVQHILLLCCSIQFVLYDLNQFQEVIHQLILLTLIVKELCSN